MNMTASKIELAIWHSGLANTAATARPLMVSNAAKKVKRHAAKYDRARLALCNGLPKKWDSARRDWTMGLNDHDTETLNETLDATQAAICEELRKVLKRGAQFTFTRDPRGGIMRAFDKQNRRDFWID